MASVHDIVIIGASFGGLPAAHGLLRDVLPRLSDTKSYHVTLINPTDEFFWKIGAPRAIAKPEGLPLEKALLDFVPSFHKYGDQFTFIKAYASSIHHADRKVALSNGKSVHYDSLVIASGTSFKSDLWSTTAGSEKVKAAYKEIHGKIPSAKSILIVGGGASGVETAGEFGENYGQTKEITLLSGSTGLLNRLVNKGIGQDAQSRLEAMGVTVINDSVRIAHVESSGSQTTLTLSTGEIKTVDIFIDATGDMPNSSFVPAAWLDTNKKVKTDSQTLRLDVPGVHGVYAIGSVASFSENSAAEIKFSMKPLLYSIEVDLRGTEQGPRTNNVYKKFAKDMQLVPVGSTGGVGTAFGWRIPSFVVRFAKAQDYMQGKAPKAIEGLA